MEQQKSAKVVRLKQPFEVKPYNKGQLCAMYNVSTYIMDKWLLELKDQLGKRVGYSYSPAQVQIIISRYGLPGQEVNEAA
jgi:hypothetical protein